MRDGLSRKDVLLYNIQVMELGISRIKEALENFEDDFNYSVIVYSHSAITKIRNIEIGITGESQENIQKRYDLKG